MQINEVLAKVQSGRFLFGIFGPVVYFSYHPVMISSCTLTRGLIYSIAQRHTCTHLAAVFDFLSAFSSYCHYEYVSVTAHPLQILQLHHFISHHHHQSLDSVGGFNLAAAQERCLSITKSPRRVEAPKTLCHNKSSSLLIELLVVLLQSQNMPKMHSMHSLQSQIYLSCKLLHGCRHFLRLLSAQTLEG